MTTAFEMFILAAEELNFTRAAERAFVTQQTLSEHIKRLEDTYHIFLFRRKPRLALTSEGETMLKYLSRMKALEDSMINELSDINAGIRGTINLGISNTRGIILIPKILPKFQTILPNVDVQVQLADTRRLEQFLLNGKIDIMLGVDASQHALFERRLIYSDPIYLVVSDELIKSYFGDDYENLITEFKNGVDLKKFTEIPFVQGHPMSTTTYAINQFLLKHSIQLRIPISVSNFDIMIDLCRSGQYATITPSFHLLQLMRLNEEKELTARLHVFPIKHFSYKLSVETITHKDAEPLVHRQVFIELIEKTLLEENIKVQEYIQTGI